MATKYRDEGIGNLFVVSTPDGYLRNPNGSLQTWTTKRGAEAVAKELTSGVVKQSSLSVSVAYEPVPVDSKQVCVILEHLLHLYKMEIPADTVMSFSFEERVNVLHFRPLTAEVHAGVRVAVGDRDILYNLSLQCSADVASMGCIRT